MTLALASMVLVLIVGVMGAIDTLYFHFWKFRLFARPQSRREHLTHAIRAALAGPTFMLLFVWPATGPMLWLVTLLIAADFAVMLWDLFEEPESRRSLGGIPPAEYTLHVVAASLHSAGYALALASRPSVAWSTTTPLEMPSLVSTLAGLLWPGALLLGLAHLALMVMPVETR